jgi:hypothetical protein
MHLFILGWYSRRDIADTETLPVGKSLEIIKNVLARTDGYLEKSVPLEIVVRVKKGMAYE